MPKRINMRPNSSAFGGAGVGMLSSAGNPWTLADDLANDLVNRGLASFVDADPRSPVPLTQDPLSGQVFAGGSPSSVSGDGFPSAEAAANGADASFLELLGSYITVEENMPSSAAVSRMPGQPFANALNNSHCYVDPVNGDDSATGYTPATAKRTLNPANWTGATTNINPQMFVLVARGSDITCNHIIGNTGTGFSGGMSLGSYGDPSKPKPIIRPTNASNYQSAGLAWTNPDGACLMDVTIDCALMDSGLAASQRNGVRFVSATNSDVFRNVLVSGVDIRPPRSVSGTWVAGLTLYKRTNDNSAAAVARSGFARVTNCTVYDGGSHGILITGAMGFQQADGSWGGVEVLDCKVTRCGRDYDSHGITSYGDNVVKATGITWTLVSGTTYYCAYNTLAGRSVFDVELANVLWVSNGSSTTCHLSKNTATPTAPAVGEFGFDNATQRLYINMGAAVTSADTLMAATQPPRGVLYAGNTVSDMPFLGLTGGFEGHGLTFDDWASDCHAIGNRSYRNGGFGLNTNKGSRNRFSRNYALDNRLGGIASSGLGALIEGNVLVGGSARAAGFKGLILQDLINGAQGLPTNIRRNLLVATSQIDAYINQSDTSGFRGEYTRASGNRGLGPATSMTVGKVLGF